MKSKKIATKEVVFSDPAQRNRWAIHFDPKFGINSFLAQCTSSLVYDGTDGEDKWLPFKISFIETVDSQAFMKLVKIAKSPHEPIVIQYLDGPGRKGNKITFVAYRILHVAQDGLDYGNDDILMSHITIVPIEVVSEEENIAYSGKEKTK